MYAGATTGACVCAAADAACVAAVVVAAGGTSDGLPVVLHRTRRGAGQWHVGGLVPHGDAPHRVAVHHQPVLGLRHGEFGYTTVNYDHGAMGTRSHGRVPCQVTTVGYGDIVPVTDAERV